MRTEQDDAPEVQRFLGWFSQRKGTSLSDKVRLKDVHDAGRGLVAVDSIPEGEELFRIPRDAVLDSQTSTLRSHIPDQLDGLDPWLSLILVLLYESFLGGNSKWYPYIQLLPQQFDTLMFWSNAELAELQASAVISRIGKKNAEAGFLSELVPIIHAYPELFPFNKDKLEEEAIRRAHIAGSQVMAYAFDVEKQIDQDDDDSLLTDDEDNPAKGMVPFADMLNADAEKNNAHLTQEDEVFIMKAIKPISKGEEIFNDYGNLPRSDLLRRYGYLADSYKQFDVVEVSLELISDVAKSQGLTRKMIQKALTPIDEIGVLDDGYPIERSDSHKLKDLIPTELLMVVKALCKQARAQEDKGEDEVRADGLYLSEVSFLHTVIVNRIAEYPTSLAQDLDILANSRNMPATIVGDSAKRRFRMALQVRIGEKEILDHVKTIAEQWIKARTDEMKDEGKKRKVPGVPESLRDTESTKIARMR